MRIIKKYEQKNAKPAPPEWFQILSEYDNQQDEQARSEGDDYSFVNYVGDIKLGIPAMMNEIDFASGDLNFKIPVYIIQGTDDILTPMKDSSKFFEKIKAPQKRYSLLGNAAHGFNQVVLDEKLRIFKEISSN